MFINFARRWDFCIHRGIVVDHIDGHTDIIHLQLYNDWLPWYVVLIRILYNHRLINMFL